MYEVDKFVDRNFFSQCVAIFGGEKFQLPLLSLASEKQPIRLRYSEVEEWIKDSSVLGKRQHRALALAAAATEYYNDDIVLNAVKSLSNEFDVFLEVAVLLISRDEEVIRTVQETLMFQERESAFEYVFAASVLSSNSDENRIRLGVLMRRINETLRPESISVEDPVVYAVVASLAEKDSSVGLVSLLKRAFRSIPQKDGGIMSGLGEYGFTYADVCRILYCSHNAGVKLGVVKDSDRRCEKNRTAILWALCSSEDVWSREDKELVNFVIKMSFDSLPSIRNEYNRLFVQSLDSYRKEMFFDENQNVSNQEIFNSLHGRDLAVVVQRLAPEEFTKLLKLRSDLVEYVGDSYYTRKLHEYCVESGLLAESEEDESEDDGSTKRLLQEFVELNGLRELDESVEEFLLENLSMDCIVQVQSADLHFLLCKCMNAYLSTAALAGVLRNPEKCDRIIQFYEGACNSNERWFRLNAESLGWVLEQDGVSLDKLSLTQIRRAESIKWYPSSDFERWMLWLPKGERSYVTEFQGSANYEVFCRSFYEFGVDVDRRVTESVAQYFGLPKSVDKQPSYVQSLCVWLKVTESPLLNAVLCIRDWSKIDKSSLIFNRRYVASLCDKSVGASIPDAMLSGHVYPPPTVFESIDELSGLEVNEYAESLNSFCAYSDLQTARIIACGEKLRSVEWLGKEVVFATAGMLYEACEKHGWVYKGLYGFDTCEFQEMVARVLLAYYRGHDVFEVGLGVPDLTLMEEWKSLAPVGVKDLLFSEGSPGFADLNDNRIRITGISVLTEVANRLSVITECPDDVREFTEKWRLPVYVRGNYPYVVRNYGSGLGKSLDWLQECDKNEYFTARLLEVFTC